MKKQFSKKSIASLAAFSMGILPAFAAAHTGGAAAADEPVQRKGGGTWGFSHENVLGTSLDMAVSAPSRSDARKAEAAALLQFDRMSKVLSAWDSSSEFTRWSKTRGVAVKVSPDLLDVLQRFDAWSGATGGVLNASTQTAAKLWGGNAVPSSEQLATAVHAMAQKHWSLDVKRGTATRLTDAPLVLASFTKSLISEKAAEAALAAGATGVMLNVGGDIVVRGALSQRVDIANPARDAENDAALDTVLLRDRAIATSGSYRRTLALGGSHVIDPRTAKPATEVVSSTVIAHDAATAGALSTALSAMGVREGQALMQQHPEAQYMMLSADGQRTQSAGWGTYAEPRIEKAGYAVHAGAAIPAPGANWNQTMELLVKLDLPRMDNPRYRRPYVAVWIEDKDKYPVRTVALWFKNPRWLNELKTWYRDDQVRNLAEGNDISATVSSATRAPGSYTLKWDGKDNAGKLVKAGKYTVVIEAAREHGGHSVVRQEIDFNGTAVARSLPASEELGAVQLDYRKH